MADSRTFQNWKDGLFTAGFIGAVAMILSLNTKVAQLEDTNNKFAKQWGQIGAIKEEIAEIREAAAYEKGYRVGKEQSCK